MKKYSLALWAALLLVGCGAPSNSESSAATAEADSNTPVRQFWTDSFEFDDSQRDLSSSTQRARSSSIQRARPSSTPRA